MEDKVVERLIEKEKKRQENTLELIASENFVSENVLSVQGCILTNKYSEGIPYKRYYGGCEYVDQIEQLAIDRACGLFDCNYANVQPHSGTSANLAVYMGLLNIGDTILSADLQNGAGHLSHGSKASIVGKLFNISSYGVNVSGFYDYDEIERIAVECQPKLIIAGASAYSRLIDYKRFREIADKVGAYLMADIAHVAGLIVANLIPSPFPYADVVTTTTHKTLRGARGGLILWNDDKFTKKINSAVFPCCQGGALQHEVAAKAVTFYEASQQEFIDYQKQVLKNATSLANFMKKDGFKIVTDGTDNHLFLVDLTPFGITGKEFQESCDGVGITLNKNTIPFDSKSTFITSGVRVGVPAVTTRGMKEDEMWLISKCLKCVTDGEYNVAKNIVKELCKKFPLYEKEN